MNTPTRNSKLNTFIDNYKVLKASKKKKNEVLRKRTYAFVIDLYTVVFTNKALSIIWLGFINKFVTNLSIGSNVSTFKFQTATTNLTLAITFLSYFFFSYYLGNGQTLGKALFKLRVVNPNNVESELTFLESFSRATGYVFNNFLFFLPFALNFLRRDQLGVQDYISATKVMSLSEIEEIIASNENEEEFDDNQIELFPAA